MSDRGSVYGNLPKLVPDASQIGTARFSFGRNPKMESTVTIADKEERAGHSHLAVMASPYYRRKLLRQCGDALLARWAGSRSRRC